MMKIVELEPEVFDRFVKTEPDSTIYHTARWREIFYHPKSTYLYIAYEDDLGFYYAFAVVEISKANSFSKSVASVNFGYLTNLYDEKLFTDFHNDLLKYLEKYSLSEITIAPAVLYDSKYGPNDLLIRKLEKLGYIKSDDTYLYVREFSEAQAGDNDYLLMVNKELDDEELKEIETQYGYSLSDAKEVFKDDFHIVASMFDIKGSIDAINEEMKTSLQVNKLVDILDKLENLKEKLGERQIIEYIGYVTYGDYAYIIYADYKEHDLNLKSDVFSYASAVLKKEGYKSFRSSRKFKGSTKIRRLGEFTFSIE